MDRTEVLKLIEKEESEMLEFKEIFKDSVLKTISAFANTSGGIIIVGVDNKREIKGVEIDDRTYQSIINKIVNGLGITPNFEIIELDKKFLLVIDVRASSIPVSFGGRYYKRVGNTTRDMNFEELKRFLQKDLRWERLSKDDFRIGDLDENTIREFLRISKSNGRLSVFQGDEPVEEILEKLGLMENGKITNACMLLFGKNPQKYFTGAKVRVVRMKDNITVIGDRGIEGNLFKQFKETEEAIKSFINVRYEIEEFHRKDIWDYPLEAIREVVANAILHRDYLRPINVQIKVYNDMIWFYNVGGLPEGWEAKKLLGLHSSVPRNPTIFNIFYLAGIVESVGSGIERMIKALKDSGAPEPKIEASHVDFTLMFFKDIYTEEYLKKMGLNERQIKAVRHIKEKGRITNREYRELFNITDRTALNDLTDLYSKGILVRIGKTGRATEYRLAEINTKNQN